MPDFLGQGKPQERQCEVISPIITETYGDNGMSRALVAYLEAKVAADEWDSRGREFGIMLACWDWFSGGTTAEDVARKIELALHG